MFPAEKNADERRLHFSNLVEIVSLLEFVHAAAGIYQLLLACEERMAFGADFNSHFGAGLGGACFESVAASADYVDFMVIGMDSFFHCFLLTRFFTTTRADCAYMI
jgi:hypothetical protein